jgi:hypothetical protein
MYWPCYPISVAGIQGQELCTRLRALALLRMTVVLSLAPVIDSVIDSQHLHMCRMRMVRMGMLTFITLYSSLILSHSCFNILNKLYVLFQRVGTSLLSSASCVKHVMACVWIRILSCCSAYVHTFWSVSAQSRHVDIDAHWVHTNNTSSRLGTLTLWHIFLKKAQAWGNFCIWKLD